MFLNIMDDNQQQKIGGITPEYPLLVEWHNMNALDVPWHWHEEVEFKYVLQGAVRVRTEQGEYEIREGEASFTNSNILETSESMDRSCNTEIFTVIFNTVLLSGYFQSIFEKKYIRPVLSNRHFDVLRITRDSAPGKNICKNLLRVRSLYEQENKEFQLRSLLSEIWLDLILEIEEHVHKKPASPGAGRDRIRYMLQFIYSNYAEKLTLEDIAGSANISEREALRTFKRILGKAPFDYLNEYRLNKARELLESTDLPITEIALDTGFSDSTYFGKVFKKYFHCTPREYRKGMQSPLSQKE